MPNEGKKSEKTIREVEYGYDLFSIAKKFLPVEQERVVYKTMQKIFGVNPLDPRDNSMYRRGGFKQNKRKIEFMKAAQKIARERGIPIYNRAVGIPLGQRALEPYLISGTDTFVDFDDVHHVNNAAIQQMVDDIKRTVIINLDIPHRVLQVRAGKEITPETVNLYLETIQHTMAGGAVAQEHMAEINPGLTADGYAKVITGDDEIRDMLDKRFLLDIDNLFHPSRVEQLKRAIGSTMFLLARVPTIAVRMADGGVVYRWAAMQSTMAFVASYRLTGESIISDLAYAAKSAQLVQMGERTWFARARSQNEIGGIPFGYMNDFMQSDARLPAKPFLKVIHEDGLDVAREYIGALTKGLGAIGAVLTEQYWLSFYMSGGIGFSTTVASAGYCGNVLEEFTDQTTEILAKYGKVSKIKPNWDTVRWVVDLIIQYCMETYEKYPSLTEYHWGGAHRISVIGNLSATVASLLTGSSTLGCMAMHYAIGLLMKEGWLRTGWAGQEVQDHVGIAYLCSPRVEEGVFPELRGMNYPVASFTAGHASGYIGAAAGTALHRGQAWSASPIVKAAFADPHLIFDFAEPRLSIAKACLRKFKPAGERDLIIPT
ncbi:MAG: methyl-coenzyme M reductase subunit alpha [Candidatus Hodarchaeota archaeon]